MTRNIGGTLTDRRPGLRWILRNDPPAALGTARSDIFFLEVRPFDNEFEEAQSQSGAGHAFAAALHFEFD